MKYLNILIIVTIMTSCAFHADVVEKDIALNINNTEDEVALFFPGYMPDEPEDFILWDNVNELLESYNGDSEFLNERYFYFKGEQLSEIDFYYDGNLRMGIIWFFPPIGIRADKNTYVLFAFDKEIFLFKSPWEDEEFEIYIKNKENRLIKLDENQYNKYFFINYSVEEKDVIIDDRHVTKEIDKIVIDMKN